MKDHSPPSQKETEQIKCTIHTNIYVQIKKESSEEVVISEEEEGEMFSYEDIDQQTHRYNFEDEKEQNIEGLEASEEDEKKYYLKRQSRHLLNTTGTRQRANIIVSIEETISVQPILSDIKLKTLFKSQKQKIIVNILYQILIPQRYC